MMLADMGAEVWRRRPRRREKFEIGGGARPKSSNFRFEGHGGGREVLDLLANADALIKVFVG
jgi:hypothetical protein